MDATVLYYKKHGPTHENNILYDAQLVIVSLEIPQALRVVDATTTRP